MHASVGPIWLVAICLGPFAVAQEAEWRITPYAWIAGLEGTIGVGDSSGGSGGPLAGDFGQLVDNMQFGGAMLCADWRRDRWSIFGDWSYATVASEAASPQGLLYGGIEAEVKANLAQLAIAREVHGNNFSRVDLFAGARFYDLDATLTLQPGSLSGRSESGGDSWFDGMAGMRWQCQLAEDWDASLYGDVGTGGSDVSWQLLASFGYRCSWGAIVGGWRHLDVDYGSDSLNLDVALTGPFFGATFYF